ncbi:hypothetical protein PGT21_017199 [Puccinia graminis f. sp. tritici]|uniref:Uncharacterized protein n=1 Tax=Puccinia graminis f. sp. tritici TaxID=56615 RepID=A0A5B0NUJ6_PUCGR|nr:hypothetical protein PGT21_017199 [Puccinia graminis f. sp. tritici]KAA1115783.1 hypothetical protein PGTUg99_031742 [Puccinia graminis f. sp. tritici]
MLSSWHVPHWKRLKVSNSSHLVSPDPCLFTSFITNGPACIEGLQKSPRPKAAILNLTPKRPPSPPELSQQDGKRRQIDPIIEENHSSADSLLTPQNSSNEWLPKPDSFRSGHESSHMSRNSLPFEKKRSTVVLVWSAKERAHMLL